MSQGNRTNTFLLSHTKQMCAIETGSCGDESAHLDAAFARDGIEANEIYRHMLEHSEIVSRMAGVEWCVLHCEREFFTLRRALFHARSTGGWRNGAPAKVGCKDLFLYTRRTCLKRISIVAITAFLCACGTVNNDLSMQPPGEHGDVFEKTFHDFTFCDARFFRTLNQEAATWKSVAPLESNGDYSWIKVEGRREDRNAHVDFTEPPTVAGLKLLSFFDEVIDLDQLGLYYNWGFMVSGKMKDVIRKFKPLIHDRARLRRDGELHVRSEVKVPGAEVKVPGASGWIPFVARSGTPVGLLKVERVIMIEPDKDDENVTRVSCSLQGGVNADILKEDRPDIYPAEYPVQLAEAFFDDVKIPENVAGVIRNIPWKPRFKKLSYTYIQENPVSAADKTPITITMEALDNLLLVREIYGPSFSVQRLRLAGPVWIQLKSRMSIGGGHVFLTTDLKVSHPAVLKKGEKFSVATTGRYQPARIPGKGRQSSRICEVGDEFGAKEIFPSLTGRAHKLSCTDDGTVTTLAYIEDLGISVALGSRLKSKDQTYRLTQFSVERDPADAK